MIELDEEQKRWTRSAALLQRTTHESRAPSPQRSRKARQGALRQVDDVLFVWCDSRRQQPLASRTLPPSRAKSESDGAASGDACGSSRAGAEGAVAQTPLSWGSGVLERSHAIRGRMAARSPYRYQIQPAWPAGRGDPFRGTLRRVKVRSQR